MAGMEGGGGGVAGFGLGGGTSAIMLLPKISRASVLSNFILKQKAGWLGPSGLRRKIFQ
jgi:hypothetical protein